MSRSRTLTNRDRAIINMSPEQYAERFAPKVKKEGRTQLVGYATKNMITKTVAEARNMELEKLRGLVEAHREVAKANENGFQTLVDYLVGPATPTPAPTQKAGTFTVLVKFEVEATSQEQANQTVLGALQLLNNDEEGLTPSQYSVIEQRKE